MTREEKKLLLKDLCARLPYGVKINIYDDYSGTMKDEELNVFHLDSTYNIEYKKLRPYLRPMSSMTEKEKEELRYEIELELLALEGEEGYNTVSAAPAAFEIDFYNKHHIDYRGLIQMDLALEASEGMYKTE